MMSQVRAAQGMSFITQNCAIKKQPTCLVSRQPCNTSDWFLLSPQTLQHQGMSTCKALQATQKQWMKQLLLLGVKGCMCPAAQLRLCCTILMTCTHLLISTYKCDSGQLQSFASIAHLTIHGHNDLMLAVLLTYRHAVNTALVVHLLP